MTVPRIVILHSGSPTAERLDDIDTLAEATELEMLASRLGLDTTRIAYEQPELAKLLARHKPQAVINLVQSISGSDALIFEATAMLEELGIRYTGNDTACLRRIATKPQMKVVLEAAGIPTARWFPEELAHALPEGRYIVKSESEHCSLGIDDSSIADAAHVAEVITDRKRRFGGRWFAEAFLEGREFNITLISDGHQVTALPVAELTFDQLPEGVAPIVDYAGKWDEQALSFIHIHRVYLKPDGPDAALAGELTRLAWRTWEACGMRGYGRVDFRLDAQGQPFVMDVNANPCLNLEAGVMAAAEQAGWQPEEVLRRILHATQH